MRFIDIHPDNPQQRNVDQAAAMLVAGDLIAYPTDSGYALGAQIGTTPITKSRWTSRKTPKIPMITAAIHKIVSHMADGLP